MLFPRPTRTPSFTRIYSRKRPFILRALPLLLLLLPLISLLLFGTAPRPRVPSSRPRHVPIPPTNPSHNPSPLNITLSPRAQAPGVTLVAACQNHHHALRHTIPTWFHLVSLDEIILIDWASTPSLHLLVEELDPLISSPRPTLYLIHVHTRTHSHPARAYNLAFRAAHFSHILRVECDHKVRHDFFSAHTLPPNSFFAGNPHLQRSVSDHDLFGTLFIEKENFFRVGGYDERIRDPGIEQDDLFKRLQRNDLNRLDVDYEKLLHAHLDPTAVKTHHQTTPFLDDRIEVETNLHLLTALTPWDSLQARKSFSFHPKSLSPANDSTQSHVHSNVVYRTITPSFNVPSVRDLATERDTEKAKNIVVSSILHKEFQLPTQFTDALSLAERTDILRRLMTRALNSSRSVTPRLLVVECEGTLVQRLFALASGLSVAAHTDRLLLVVWQKERISPNNTSFNDLFQIPQDFVHVNIDEDKVLRKNIKAKVGGEQRKMMHFYDLTNSSEQEPVVIDSTGRTNIYVRASQALTTNVPSHTNPMSLNERLQRLTIHESIRNRVRLLENEGLSNAVGVYSAHVESNQMSKFKAFSFAVREMVLQAPGVSPVHVYVDSDPRLYQDLKQLFGTILVPASVTEDCGSDDLACAKTEMTRLLALSKVREVMCFHDDNFCALVRLFRGHSADW